MAHPSGCLCCGAPDVRARGLCATCHSRHRRAGTLAQYPRIAARPPPHGSPARYGSGCRCDPCTAASTAARRAERLDRRQRPGEVPHGIGGYRNWECRCGICLAAHLDDMAGRQAAAPGDPAQRRQPWTDEDLALAARPDLTAVEVAALTGRSYSAVVAARYRLPRPSVPRSRRKGGAG